MIVENEDSSVAASARANVTMEVHDLLKVLNLAGLQVALCRMMAVFNKKKSLPTIEDYRKSPIRIPVTVRRQIAIRVLVAI